MWVVFAWPSLPTDKIQFWSLYGLQQGDAACLNITVVILSEAKIRVQRFGQMSSDLTMMSFVHCHPSL